MQRRRTGNLAMAHSITGSSTYPSTTRPDHWAPSPRNSSSSAPADLQRGYRATTSWSAPEVRQLWSVSEAGKAEGQLRVPKDVCFFGPSTVAVSEQKNSRIQFFDSMTGRSNFCIDKTTYAGLRAPSAICPTWNQDFLLAADGNLIHILDVSNHDWLDFCDFQKRKRQVHGVCVMDSRDDLVVSEIAGISSVGIHTLTGRHVRDLRAEYGKPYYVTTDRRTGHIYVSDSEKGCVHVFDKHGKNRLYEIGKKVNSRERLVWPLGICISREGHLLVADRARGKILVYTSTGRFLGDLFQGHEIKNPVAIATNDNGLYALTEENLDYGKDSYALKIFQEYDTRQV